MWQLRTLGGLSVQGGAAPAIGAATQRKALALLGLLAMGGSRGVSRDKLVAWLWPESPGDRVGHRLTQLLYSLRRDLGAETLFLGTNELRLNPGVMRADVDAFSAALEAGDIAGAVGAYGGPFLDGFFLPDAPDFERRVDDERARLAEHFASAVEQLAAEAVRRGDYATAGGWWRRLSQLDPLNSRVAVHYIEALGALGDRAGTLRFLRSYEALLRAEFDAVPDAAVSAAAERVRGAIPPPAAPLPPAIAVLPFVNVTPERENEYFSDGMTDEIASALAQVPGLRVASRIASFAFKGRAGDPREVAERLGVSALVCGTVRKVGNRVRLTAQLVSGADGCQLWSGIYERTLADVFAMQEELAHAIVAELPLLGRSAPVPQTRWSTADPDAYALYLRGRYSANKRTPEEFALGTEYFEQALERDPGYALAHAGLAECWALRGFPEFGDCAPHDAMPKARVAALAALQIDPQLSQAHTWLGVVHFVYDWDFIAAENKFRTALRSLPGNAFAETWYANLLCARGRCDEGIRRALYAETLEPLAPQISLAVARCYYWARRYQEALQCVTGILRAAPTSPLPQAWLARVLSALGRDDEALAAMENIPMQARIILHDAQRALALAKLGRVEEARSTLAVLSERIERERAPAAVSRMAAAHAALGDVDSACVALDAALACRSGFLSFVLIEPELDSLRSHPRFQAIVKDMGLTG